MKRWEKKLQNELILKVGGLPWIRLWRHNVGKARPLSSPRTVVSYGVPGQGDVLGFMAAAGRFISLECKAPGGTLGDPQRAWLQTVNTFGGVGLVIRLPSGTTEETLDDEIAACVALAITELESFR